MHHLSRSTAVCALALAACSGSDPMFGGGGSRQASRDAVAFDAIQFETTAGTFTAVLYPEAAPETVERYLEYADTGYYVGRSFDRVIPGFVIQQVDCLISFLTDDTRRLPLEVTEEHFFSAGALGVARAADPNSGGPEFFVMDFAAGHLAGDYTVFGQVVEGIEAVRAAARVQAIDFTVGGQVPFPLADRCALEPVEITATTRTTVMLPPDQAARLPLKTAERVSTETAGYNLEWPASLTAGDESELTAFIRMKDSAAAPPAAADVRVTIGGPEIAVEGDPTAAGIYHFRWTPPAAGEYEATISAAGGDLATLVIQVPP